MKYFAMEIGLINRYLNNIWYFTQAADYFPIQKCCLCPLVCGKDVYLPLSELSVKAIKLKDSSFLALLYAKLLFGLHIIVHIAR